ncbi:uncharacterized protein LOC111282083 [Durio zibethinus]|uniref:Uncharacterized protein LOC111282083 n=1 Tax=Durio zibethinus TaxID=66656 RepID=A0A6P5XD15_DURZI|nr:uncharacterized protein LOC111282083 [Durio zibethinus]
MRISRSNEVEIRSRLKDAILSKLAASNPSMPINPDLVHLRLLQFFPTFHTPIHPPYSSMIQQAILKLNEECGSSEEAISRFLENEYEGLPWGHASFLSHHLKKLCRNGEIVCVDNERYMLHVDDVDLGGEKEEMSHRLNISNRNEKEDQTLVQGKGREVEAIDGWSGVNGDQAEEYEDRCDVERQSVEVNNQKKACEQRIERFEEQKEGRQELIKKVQEQSQNFSGQIELVEEVDVAKGKLAELAQEQRGEKRKQPQKTKQQIKVLKDDTRPMMEEEKKYVEERQQQPKNGSGVMKSVGEQEQLRQGEMIIEQGHPQDQKIGIRAKMLVFPCDGDGKTSLRECSMHLLEEEKKVALEHMRQQQRKLHHRERNSIIVCALPAQLPPQSGTNIYQKAHKLHTDSISASLETRESGQILLQQLKPFSPQRPADLQVTTFERFNQNEQKPAKFYTRREIQNSQPKVKTSFDVSEHLEELEEKHEQQFQKPEKLLEYEIKTNEANFCGEEAAVSLSVKVQDSMNDLGPHGRELPKKRIKVYVRRNVSKCKLKESENSNILSTNSE